MEQKSSELVESNLLLADQLLLNCSLNSSVNREPNQSDCQIFVDSFYFDIDTKDLLEGISKKMMRALDLRKKMNNEEEEDVETLWDDEDNGITPLDLTARPKLKSSSPPPATPILAQEHKDNVVAVAPHHPIKSLTAMERRDLKAAYQKLVRFLRLDSSQLTINSTDPNRPQTLRRLQSFLLMYLNEVKRKSPNGLDMFNRSFDGEKAIRGFLHLVIGESNKQLARKTLSGSTNNLRPAKFAVDPAMTVFVRGVGQSDRHAILSRGAVRNEQRRQDNSLSSHPYAHPAGFRAGQQQHYPAMVGAGSFTSFNSHEFQQGLWSQQPMPHAQLQQSLSAPINSLASEDIPVDLVEMVLTKFPNFNEELDVLPAEDLLELEEIFNGLDDPVEGFFNSPPQSNMNSNPTSPGSAFGSFPGSPGSPWQTHTNPALMNILPSSPYSNNPYMLTPPPSCPSTVCSSPGMLASPLPRSMLKGMNQMTLQAPNQPPALIPLKAGSPQPTIRNHKNPLLTSFIQPPPFASAKEEMMTKLDPVVKEKSLCRVTKEPMETFTRPDLDGDTPLMVASANPNIKLEDLYALIERLKSHPERNKLFTAYNNRRETAIYLAAAEHRPLVSGYLAETMSALRIPMNQSYQKGNSLIHEISSWGDDTVLQYLLRVRTLDNSGPAFDLNATNREGRSALHEAVTLYRPNDATSQNYVNVIQLLLEYGADPGLSDKTSGKTPVHIAIEKRDCALLELLFVKCSRPEKAANAPMYNDNRPLHNAATLSGVTDVQQLELVNILLKYGADKTLRNKANKLPIELVQQDRERVKGVLQARARQNHYGGN